MWVYCNYPLFLNHLINKWCHFRVLFLHNSWGWPGTRSTRPTRPIQPENRLTWCQQQSTMGPRPQNLRPAGQLTGLSMKTRFSTDLTGKYTRSGCSLLIRESVSLIFSDLSRSSMISSRSGLISSRSVEILSRSRLISSRSGLISLKSA